MIIYRDMILQNWDIYFIPIDMLPVETIKYIFLYVDTQSLLSNIRVNRFFNKLIIESITVLDRSINIDKINNITIQLLTKLTSIEINKLVN